MTDSSVVSKREERERRRRRGLRKVCGSLQICGHLLKYQFRFQEVQGKEEVDEGRLYIKNYTCTEFYATAALLAFGIRSWGRIVKGCQVLAKSEMQSSKAHSSEKFVQKAAHTLIILNVLSSSRVYNTACNAALEGSNSFRGYGVLGSILFKTLACVSWLKVVSLRSIPSYSSIEI